MKNTKLQTEMLIAQMVAQDVEIAQHLTDFCQHDEDCPFVETGNLKLVCKF